MTNLHFTTVLGVRRVRSDERVVSRRELPNLPCGKKEEILKRSSIFEEQPSKSSSFQQPFSAAFLSSSSQQLFSAAFLSSSSQQLFSAALLSSLSQHSFQQPFSAAFLSSSSQQLLSAVFPSSSSQQLFSAAILSSLFSAIILLWSGVGGQLVTSSCCSQGLVVKYAPVL